MSKPPSPRYYALRAMREAKFEQLEKAAKATKKPPAKAKKGSKQRRCIKPEDGIALGCTTKPPQHSGMAESPGLDLSSMDATAYSLAATRRQASNRSASGSSGSGGKSG